MPSDDDRTSFCALVEEHLHRTYPTHSVEAYVDEKALDSNILTDDPDIDRHELCTHIGTEVWDDWCSGERAEDPT